MSVRVLEEIKWFRDAVYEINGGALLTAGRPTPADGVTTQRGEGVALELLSPALVWWQTVEGMVFKVYFSISEVSWSCWATPRIVLLCTY